MTLRDGGAAFPGVIQYPNDHVASGDGMTLRDWFAGQAIKGLIEQWPDGMDLDAPLAAACAYEYADAMLAARAES